MEYQGNLMLIRWVGLTSSAAVLYIQAAPGARRVLPLTAGSRCDKRKDPAHTMGLSKGIKCKQGTGNGS